VLARVDDLAAEILDLAQRAGDVGDREVGQGGGVAGAAAALVDADPDALGLGHPAGPFALAARAQVDLEQFAPEPLGALGVVGGELDQRRHQPALRRT
jgi:hypothetical protein